MSLTSKFIEFYFDRVYNPVYDLTTAKVHAYRELQQKCIGKFLMADGDSILCVGVGTGNEIPYMFNGHKGIEITGIDTSERALKKAYQKSLKKGREIKTYRMDAQKLAYPAGRFSKVLCLHVMDFLENGGRATEEMVRVLKDGGEFVITYPSAREGVRFGARLLSDSFRRGRVGLGRAFLQLLLQMVVGVVYVPLLFRSKQKCYSYGELEDAFKKLKLASFHIEEYPLYNDLIVYGRK